MVLGHVPRSDTRSGLTSLAVVAQRAHTDSRRQAARLPSQKRGVWQCRSCGLPRIGDFWPARARPHEAIDGLYQGATGNWNLSDTGLTYPEGVIEALVERVAAPADASYFRCEKYDNIMVMLGNGFVVPFEVVEITGNVNMPPYVRKYHLNPRSDLARGI